MRTAQRALGRLDGSGTDIPVDSVSGRWELTREPWRFTIDYLHIGTVDARIGSSSSRSSGPVKLPKDLRLPIQLDVQRLTLDKLRAAQGATTTEFSRFALSWTQRRPASRGERRESGHAVRRGDGGRRSSMAGAAVSAAPATSDYSGKVSDEAVQVGARI